MKSIKLGTTISFKPCAFTDFQENSAKAMGALTKVTGTVIYIHHDHRYIRVRYKVHDKHFYECFKI